MRVCQRPENALTVARFSPLTAECRGIVVKNVPRKPNSRRRLASATSSKPPHPSGYSGRKISLFFKGSHPHGLFTTVHLQTCNREQTAGITNQFANVLHPQSWYRGDACWQSLSSCLDWNTTKGEQEICLCTDTELLFSLLFKIQSPRRSPWLYLAWGCHAHLQSKEVMALCFCQEKQHTHVQDCRQELL